MVTLIKFWKHTTFLESCSQDLGKTNKQSWCEGADDFNHNKDSQWRGHKQSNGGEGTQINKSQW